MADGLLFATLATLIGKKNAARWGTRLVTIGAVGWQGKQRYVMGTLSDGTVVLGDVSDFAPVKRTRKAK